MIRVKQVVLVWCMTLGVPIAVWAGSFDGTRPLVCAVTMTHECSAIGECLAGTAESIDIPQFVLIDFENKKVRSLPGAKPVRNTPINTMTKAEGNLVLQGMQRGRAWSLVLNETNGKLVLSASDYRTGFVVFGACVAP